MQFLDLKVRAVTPAYIAGADGSQPELRVPSFKGPLRFWYRAFDPIFRYHEPEIFGGAAGGHGQSAFLLRVSEHGPSRRWSWERGLVERFGEGRGRGMKNGISYLANMAVPRRQAIAPNAEFTMRVTSLRRLPEPEVRRALLGSLWLLFHLGGAGSRSRRGFGSFSLERWGPTDEWPEARDLPLLASCRDAAEAREALGRAVRTLQTSGWPGWPLAAGEREHQRLPRLNPHIGARDIDAGGSTTSKFRLALDPRGFRADARDAWAAAMNEAGRALQDFRLRRAPDYDNVKTSLSGRGPLRRAPERATFGLPIAFRFRGIQGGAQFGAFRGTPAGGYTSDRHASLLFVRVLRIGDRLHPAYFRLDGPVPAAGPGSTSAVLARSRGGPLAPPSQLALDDFMDQVSRRWGGS